MDGFRLDRRTVLRGLAGAGAIGAASSTAAADFTGTTDPTTSATFRAIVDAVIPETPDVADELGEEHRPGGLAIGLDAYLIEYVNTLFSTGNSLVGELGDLRLAEVVATACDAAAAELLARGENDEPPDPTRFEAGGPFAWLARDDRLRALALLDEKEVDTAALPGPVLEGSAGLIPQLVVAFTQVIYYSEWEGYESIEVPPSERSFDGEGLQSWAQTDFPGILDGAAVHRGYLGTPDSSLGGGSRWAWIDAPAGRRGPPVGIYLEAGEFAENDYDTADYEEPFDTSGEPAGGFDPTEGDVRRFRDAVDDGESAADDELLGALRDRLGGSM